MGISEKKGEGDRHQDGKELALNFQSDHLLGSSVHEILQARILEWIVMTL